MGDRKSSKRQFLHIKKILNLTFHAAEELKDEAYVQILKQTREHKDYDKMIRGWSLMAILASCFAPSLELYYPLLNYLFYEIRNNKDQNILKRCNYIIIRLTKSHESKRRQIPSYNEIIHIENMKPIMFPVFFFSEAYTMVPTESYTTIKELKTTIMRKLQLNISRIPYYALYEICYKKGGVIEERFLNDNQKVVDIAALWAKEREELETNEEIEFKIYLKIQFYYDYKNDDVDTIAMHYVQTNHDVIKGSFALSDAEVAKLGAIQLWSNYGQMKNNDLYKYLEKNLEKYVPVDQIKHYYSAEIWINKIQDLYNTFKTFETKLQAKTLYLELLRGNNLWEAHQYTAKVTHKFIFSLPKLLTLKISINSLKMLLSVLNLRA